MTSNLDTDGNGDPKRDAATRRNSSRALAKQQVAQSWASRRPSTKPSSSRTNSTLPAPICVFFKNAWEQTWWRLRSFSTNNSSSNERQKIRHGNIQASRQRVLESVTRQQVAKAVASQVVETFEEQNSIVLSVLPAGYDFHKAIESLACSRKRAFLLMDLAAICKAHVELTKTLGTRTQLQYTCGLNRDAALLELLVRLQTSIRCNSNQDVLVASNANAKIVDHAQKTRKPNGYLKRIAAYTDSFAVDGPQEVCRIHETLQTNKRKQVMGFVLKLPNEVEEWRDILQKTVCAARSLKCRFDGISIDLEHHLDSLGGLVQSLQDLVVDFGRGGFRIDVTGLPQSGLTPSIQGFFEALSHCIPDSTLTVDASHLLVAHAGALCTRIIGRKRSDTPGFVHYYIDDGCYGSLQTNGLLPSQELSPKPLVQNNNNDTSMIPSTVWGPTCDGLDRVCKEVLLPPLNVDDWLVFPNLGCGGFGGGLGLGTAFNGFEPPDTAYCVLGYFQV